MRDIRPLRPGGDADGWRGPPAANQRKDRPARPRDLLPDRSIATKQRRERRSRPIAELNRPVLSNIEAPDVTPMARPQPHAGAVVLSGTPRWSMLSWNLEHSSTPDPLHAIARLLPCVVRTSAWRRFGATCPAPVCRSRDRSCAFGPGRFAPPAGSTAVRSGQPHPCPCHPTRTGSVPPSVKILDEAI